MKEIEIENKEKDFQKKKTLTQERISRIQRVKLHMINGNYNEAKVLLKDATITDNFTKKIQFRYLSIINFIEGNYKVTLDLLAQPEMKDFSAYTRTCVMKVISLIILNKNEKLQIEWPTCRDSLLSKSPTNLAWLQTIVNLKLSRDPQAIQKIFSNIAIDNSFKDELRIYLKLALYLNMENKLIPRFKYFGFDQIKDFRTRELIGLNHFRNGDLEKAYLFLEDLNTVNAEVFKGNLYLFQKKKELAFAQYKLALKKKENSMNALERIIPLAWQLSQWDQGYIYVNNIKFTKIRYTENMALRAAFLTMSGRSKEAENILRQITEITHSANPLEVAQIYAYNALINEKHYESENYASQGCVAKDALNCWLAYQLQTWENLSQITKSERSIHEDVEDLVSKLTKEPLNNPIKDNIYLDQKMIEELDDNLINLVPNVN